MKKIHWLVIGIGDITRKRVLPAILAERRSILDTIVTRDLGKAGAYPGVRGSLSLEESLRDEKIDAVYVASPVSLHASQTIASLRAGKHVLCEKPVGMNFDEAQKMVATADETGRQLGVAYYRRLFPKIVRARRLLGEGAIGTPLLGEAKCHGWLESEERAWLRDPAQAGGGPLYDSGSHRIDAFNFLFGRPFKAVGLLSNVVHSFGVEDSATAVTDHENAARSIVDARWNSRIARDEFRIIGTEGELDMSPLGGPSLRFGGKEELLPVHENVHYPLVENFVGALLDGTPLACPGVEAIRTDWVTASVADSARAGS